MLREMQGSGGYVLFSLVVLTMSFISFFPPPPAGTLIRSVFSARRLRRATATRGPLTSGSYIILSCVNVYHKVINVQIHSYLAQ